MTRSFFVFLAEIVGKNNALVVNEDRDVSVASDCQLASDLRRQGLNVLSEIEFIGLNRHRSAQDVLHLLAKPVVT